MRFDAHPLVRYDPAAVNGGIQVLKLEYFEAKTTVAPVPRNQEVPKEAFGTLTGRSILVATSHAWFHQCHPDPHGVKLDILRKEFFPRLRALTGPKRILSKSFESRDIERERESREMPKNRGKEDWQVGENDETPFRVENLFRVEGMTCVVTGGGSGKILFFIFEICLSLNRFELCVCVCV
jgi:hypothetical protein